MRYLLITLFLFLFTNCYAEQYKLENNFIINLPNNTIVIKEPVFDAVERAFKTRRYTEKEKKIAFKMHLESGETKDDIIYSLSTKEEDLFYKKDQDPFGKAENDIFLLGLINECEKLFKINKKITSCAMQKLQDYFKSDGVNYFFILFINNDPKYEKLFNMSDDELSNLSKKSIKNIRNKFASNINWKSKNKYFKEKGIRNIKITGTGDFYIETISTETTGKWKETNIRLILPYNNRRFIINATCRDEKCKNVKNKIAKILEPTFKINPNGVKVYDFNKKQDMLDLIQNVKNGYRIFRFAKLIFLIV